jgi:large conductance mechanosensitive channel
VSRVSVAVLLLDKKFVKIILMDGFKKFILRGNVVDLAVGVIIGAAFNTVVQSLVKSFFTPIISLMTGDNKLSTLYFTVHGTKINYGDFVNALISFLIIAAVVYFFVVMPMNKLQQLSQSGKTVDPTIKKCPFCFSDINIKATRCAYCTAVLKSNGK